MLCRSCTASTGCTNHAFCAGRIANQLLCRSTTHASGSGRCDRLTCSVAHRIAEQPHKHEPWTIPSHEDKAGILCVEQDPDPAIKVNDGLLAVLGGIQLGRAQQQQDRQRCMHAYHHGYPESIGVGQCQGNATAIVCQQQGNSCRAVQEGGKKGWWSGRGVGCVAV